VICKVEQGSPLLLLCWSVKTKRFCSKSWEIRERRLRQEATVKLQWVWMPVTTQSTFKFNWLLTLSRVKALVKLGNDCPLASLQQQANVLSDISVLDRHFPLLWPVIQLNLAANLSKKLVTQEAYPWNWIPMLFIINASVQFLVLVVAWARTNLVKESFFILRLESFLLLISRCLIKSVLRSTEGTKSFHSAWWSISVCSPHDWKLSFRERLKYLSLVEARTRLRVIILTESCGLSKYT
jgi:hypothetical protein